MLPVPKCTCIDNVAKTQFQRCDMFAVIKVLVIWRSLYDQNINQLSPKNFDWHLYVWLTSLCLIDIVMFDWHCNVWLTSLCSQVLDRDHTSVSAPAVGEFYAGQFVDGSWYRCRVDACDLDRNVTVTYIDYGNKEMVSCSKLRKLRSEWCSLPGQVGGRWTLHMKLWTPDFCRSFFSLHLSEKWKEILKSLRCSSCNLTRIIISHILLECVMTWYIYMFMVYITLEKMYNF